ncbi:hypothetical protein DMUE_2625 [Dictyocoela muelleri]|nr:hypothetical protein DMUE_2625 [Dictyocoela muelleri]
MEYFTTQRGSKIFLLEVFLYLVYKKEGYAIRCRCKYRFCKGFILLKNETLTALKSKSHTYDSNIGKNAVIISMGRIFKRCKEVNEAFSFVFTSETSVLNTCTLKT